MGECIVLVALRGARNETPSSLATEAGLNPTPETLSTSTCWRPELEPLTKRVLQATQSLRPLSSWEVLCSSTGAPFGWEAIHAR